MEIEKVRVSGVFFDGKCTEIAWKSEVRFIFMER